MNRRALAPKLAMRFSPRVVPLSLLTLVVACSATSPSEPEFADASSNASSEAIDSAAGLPKWLPKEGEKVAVSVAWECATETYNYRVHDHGGEYGAMCDDWFYGTNNKCETWSEHGVCSGAVSRRVEDGKSTWQPTFTFALDEGSCVDVHEATKSCVFGSSFKSDAPLSDQCTPGGSCAAREVIGFTGNDVLRWLDGNTARAQRTTTEPNEFLWEQTYSAFEPNQGVGGCYGSLSSTIDQSRTSGERTVGLLGGQITRLAGSGVSGNCKVSIHFPESGL